jgi:excisionase family DNA binding protein
MELPDTVPGLSKLRAWDIPQMTASYASVMTLVMLAICHLNENGSACYFYFVDADAVLAGRRGGVFMVEKMYSKKEVAELLGVTVRTIENYINAGLITGVRIGSRWRFPESEIERIQTEGIHRKST